MTRRRLDSWKEIAAYLKRDATTVRRWEKREGLPVHRHVHDKLGSVYAYTDEIDEWTTRRRVPASSAAIELNETPPHFTAAPRYLSPRSITVLALLATVVVSVIALRPRSQTNPVPMLADRQQDFAIVPPEGVSIASLALSPAGDQVVFTGTRSGEAPRLWIRRLDSISAAELPGTDDASFPFWSSDGRHVGFFAQRQLKTIAVGTHDIRSLADAPDGRGGSWSEHDQILFAPYDEGPIMLVPAQGGVVTNATSPDPVLSDGQGWPVFLPGGRSFLYFDQHRSAHGIYIADLDSGAVRHLVKAYSSAALTDDGYLLYSAEHLMAQKFDLVKRELVGEPVMVADHVLTHYGWHHKSDFSISRNGLLALRRGQDGGTRLSWVDRRGRELGSLTAGIAYSNPVIAPDGIQAVVTMYDRGTQQVGNLWRVDLNTLQAARLTFGPMLDVAPIWSPGGDRLVYLSMRDRRMLHLERLMIQGGEDAPWAFAPPARAGSDSLRFLCPESWSRDGRWLTYSALHPETKGDVWILDLGGDRILRPLFNGRRNQGHSQIAPDNQRIAYASDEAGNFEVYVSTFPVPGPRWQVSTGGGVEPRWSSDGRELYYVAADRKMMAVAVSPDGSRFGSPRALFQTDFKYLWQDTRNHYDVTPDGNRFLLLASSDDPRSEAFTIVLNWKAALTPADAARGGRLPASRAGSH